MKRCLRCVIPDTRPDTAFVDGVCSACLAFERRAQIDWTDRGAALTALLTRHDGRCIVPSSGGKDSTWQVLKLLELGAKPIVVTASTCHLTPIGRANIDNLARYATTIEVTPERTVRAQLNNLGLRLVGDISWPEHVSIFTTPFIMAAHLRAPLIFYGENPQAEYGGPMGSEQAMQMTRRWVSEFGGFLGLRPRDLIGQTVNGCRRLTEHDLAPYDAPAAAVLQGIEAHFLGAYVPWDSQRNASVAGEHGMICALPSQASWWTHENLDNAQTGLHDHACYRKYGYGRLAAQVSVDVRHGRMSRAEALDLVRERDGLFPYDYAGVSVRMVLERIGMDFEHLTGILDGFTNWDLFAGVDNNRPILKEFAAP